MTVLVVSPHYDDAELSASLALPGAHLLVLAGGDDDRRREQERASRSLQTTFLKPGTLPDGRIASGPGTVRLIEKALRISRADTLLLPPLLDSHQDHRAVHRAGISAARRSPLTVVEYETVSALPEWTPNLWEAMSEAEFDEQVRAVECHVSQAHRPYTRESWLRTRAAYRGQQVGVPLAQAYRYVRAVGHLPGTPPFGGQ